eukprot:SAG25_NODE_1079_length_4095_cov_1.941191_2_plen_62_part_00
MPAAAASQDGRTAARSKQGSQVEGEEGERPPASLAHLPLPSPCIIQPVRTKDVILSLMINS